MNSLKNFIRVIKLNEEKKIKLYERLDWINACMTAVSSPTYDRVGGTTNVKPERIMLLLEKKDRVRRAIKKIEIFFLFLFITGLMQLAPHSFQICN